MCRRIAVNHEGKYPRLTLDHRGEFQQVAPIKHVGEITSNGARGNNGVLQPKLDTDMLVFWILYLGNHVPEA